MEKPIIPSNVEANNAKLLEAQAQIWHHMFNFVTSLSLKCAIELNIPDIIQTHNKPITLSQLIEKLPIHNKKSQFVHRIMRVLVSSGFFALEEVCESDQHDQLEQGYALTDASKLLLKDSPFSVMPHFLIALDSLSTKPFHSLSAWFQNDDLTPFGTTHGMEIWEYAGRDPSWGSLFNDAMANDARLVASVMIDKSKSSFEGLESLVDVGGGTGTVARAIAAAFPRIECTVLDQPRVVAGLEGSENLKFVGGDMFDAIPPADAVLLKVTQINFQTNYFIFYIFLISNKLFTFT